MKLQKQLRELIACQGHQTRDYVEGKLKNFLDVEDINIQELNRTIKEIKSAIESDEDTFKLINGIIESNKNKLKQVEMDVETLKEDKVIYEDDIKRINATTKECLRVVEEDLFVDVSELCNIYGSALHSVKSDDDL
jgi:DNA repair exonuclease SbcCD ATPase subunit